MDKHLKEVTDERISHAEGCRESVSATENSEGTGLGLVCARRI